MTMPPPLVRSGPRNVIGALVDVVTGRRAKYLVVACWLALLVLAVPIAGKLADVEHNEAQSWLPVSAESTKVLKAQAAFRSPNLLPAVVVYHRLGGLDAGDRTKIATDTARFAHLAHVAGPVSPAQYAADGTVAAVVIPFDLGAEGWQRAAAAVAAVRAVAGGRAGLETDVTGAAGYAADASQVFAGIDGTLLYSTLAIVVFILLLTYRSPLLWLLPVLSAGAALMSAEAVIYLFARHAGLTVNAQSAGILTVLVFGAGTDYALLLVARYREELRARSDRHAAMRAALRRAGPAIIASASTVILGLLCLLLAETNSTKGLGPVAAIGIGVGLVSMLSLLPALLVIAGRWIFWPTVPRFASPEPTAAGAWARVGNRIARHPRRIWAVTAFGLALLALGLLGFSASGLTNREAYVGHPAAVRGEELLAAHLPASGGSPMIVISRAAAATAVRAALVRDPGLASVSPPLDKGGRAYFQATLRVRPDSKAARGIVERVRAELHVIPGAGALVGGDSAINLDVQQAAAHDRNLVIPVVLAVVFVVLALLLRALIAPLLLIGTVVLSFFAALGVSALAYRHLFGFAGADTGLPLYVFVFLVALGIDYNIFLVSRVREEALRHGTRRGAISALAATGGVITSAGVVLAGTFAVLATLPLTTFVEIGFAVAFGVLVDTTVVRSVLVTALNLDLGDAMWWPVGLGRHGIEPLSDTSLRQGGEPGETAGGRAQAS